MFRKGIRNDLIPSIAASGSNVYVVWFDNTPGNFEIFLRKSVNAGDAFGSTVNYSHSLLEIQLLHLYLHLQIIS